jgi:two-component system cell cycle sensor histidine kinase/response regulator CckA
MDRASDQTNPAPPSRWAATRAVATKIALVYALVGVVWIISSDWLVHILVPDNETEVLINTLKGWFYVSITALLLWLALDFYFRQIRRTANLLRESEQRWKFALESADHGVWDWNTATNEVYFSQRFTAMLGYTGSEFGKDLAAWESRVHPEDLPTIMAQLRPHLEGLTPSYECEHRVCCKDGSYIWVLDQGQVIQRDAEGKPLRMIGTHTDITERKRAEHSLRESENRFRTLFENSAISIIVHDPATRAIVHANRRAVESYGLASFAELQRNEFWGDPPYSRADAERLIQRAAAEGPQRFEWKNRSRSGNVFWEDVLLNPIVLDGKPCVMAVAYDITARKEAEAALATEAIRRRILVEQSHDGIVVLDQHGRVVEANQRYAQMLGYTMDEVRQLHVWDWDARYERAQIEQMMQTIGPSGAHFETQHRRKDGTVFEVELSNNGAVIDGQKLIFCVCRDISQRKQAERALRERELQLRLFIEHSPAAIAMFDNTMHYLCHSKRWLLDYNLGERDLVGLSHYEVFPEIPERWRQIHQRCLAGAVEKSDADPFQRANGTQDWVHWEIHPWRNTDDQIGGLIIFSEVITARVQAQAALQASEERFRRVVESAPEAIFIRTGATFAYVNAAALKLFGATAPEQLLGRPVLDRFQAESRSPALERIQRLDTDQEPTLSANRTLLRLDGQAVPVILSAVPFNYQEQRSALVFARDMSEHKQLEAQFRQAQKLEAIGQLAGGVAHDFNNILAATMMHLGLLQMNPALDAETRQTLKELEEENRRAVTLTRQLLMFSRRSALDVKPVNLNELVANLLKMLTRLIGENIDLRSEGQAGLPLVEADAGMLEQVLMNLIVNARDAMPQGGRITIRTTGAEIKSKQADLNVNRRPGRFVCLAVSDVGCGMDTEILKRIFDPFFTTKEAGKGTGLGLATVHGIVAQHKGWVEVESRVGKGSTFHVFLPALANGQKVIAPESETTTLHRGGETILLVEDDPRVRLTTGQFLRLLGYRVYDAANGHEALKLWELHGANVDLLFTDMIMPEGLTGLELAEQLQRRKPGLKVIISSGYSHEIAQHGIPKKPGIVFLSKPHEPKKLSDLVRASLDQRPQPPA